MAASVEMLKGYGCVAVGSLINKYTTSTRKATERQRFAVWKTIFGFLIFLSWEKKKKKKELGICTKLSLQVLFYPSFSSGWLCLLCGGHGVTSGSSDADITGSSCFFVRQRKYGWGFGVLLSAVSGAGENVAWELWGKLLCTAGAPRTSKRIMARCLAYTARAVTHSKGRQLCQQNASVSRQLKLF